MNTENILTDLCIIEQKIESLRDAIKNEPDLTYADYHLANALFDVKNAKSELEPNEP